MKLEFSRQIFEKKKDFLKIRPVGTDLFYVDGQTDRHDEDNNSFRNFANAPRN